MIPKKALLKRILILLCTLSVITVCGAGALYLLRPVPSAQTNAGQAAAYPPTAPSAPESESSALTTAPTSDAAGRQPSLLPGDNSSTDAPISNHPESGETASENPESKQRVITLMAVGDNLMHMGVVYTGRQSDGTYNYDFLFENISDFLAVSDIKIINQETILGGNQLGFSGFPHFNSPTEVGDGIAAAGFNVVLHASNHAADQGFEGLDHCVDFWRGHPEVLLTGIHEPISESSAMVGTETPLSENQEISALENVDSLPIKKEDASATNAAKNIPLLTIDGVNFAILNYTYGPNMEVIPASLRERLNILCAYNERSGLIDFKTLNPIVTEEIRLAKTLADVVIVCPHWGTEYSSVPSKYQKKFALEMTEAGADVIIGTHPHVVQPVEWIESENGNRSLCFYSLGNYVSTQKKPLCMLEAMAYVTFTANDDGISISPECSGAIPLVCHYTSGPVRIKGVYLLEDYTEEQAASHGIRNYGEAPLTLQNLLDWRDEILGDFVLSAKDVLPVSSNASQDTP